MSFCRSIKLSSLEMIDCCKKLCGSGKRQSTLTSYTTLMDLDFWKPGVM